MADLERDGPVYWTNMGLRFLLEVAALVALGYWGWTGNEGVARIALAVGLPLLAAAVWGVFRTPGDGSGGEGVVATPGPVRLGIEAVLFGGAVALLWLADRPLFAGILGGLVAAHYAVDYRRVRWLLTGDG